MDKLSLEDELFILEQGIQTNFWQLIESKWSGFLKHAEDSLISPNYTNRDFLAGKVRGMKDLLNYPEKHIDTVKRQITSKNQPKVV